MKFESALKVRRFRGILVATVAALALVVAQVATPAVGLATRTGLTADTARAAALLDDEEEPIAPELGDEVLRNALDGEEIFPPGTCPTGLASGKNVGEGFRLEVRGRCVQSAPATNLPIPARRIFVWDGDVSLDFKVVAGAERAGINLYVRIREDRLMATYLDLSRGKVELLKREGGVNTTLESRDDLGDTIDPTEWNHLSLRANGTELWLLLNDVPILQTALAIDQPGNIGIGVVREGNPNDNVEVAVVFRDLTLTALAEGDPDRAPIYQRP